MRWVGNVGGGKPPFLTCEFQNPEWFCTTLKVFEKLKPQINLSTLVPSQVRKVDPVPASSMEATVRAGTGSAFLTCKVLKLERCRDEECSECQRG
jgi:hypothetical protein